MANIRDAHATTQTRYHARHSDVDAVSGRVGAGQANASFATGIACYRTALELLQRGDMACLAPEFPERRVETRIVVQTEWFLPDCVDTEEPTKRDLKGILKSRLKMWAAGDVQLLAEHLIRLGMCWPLSLVRMLEIERQVRTAAMNKLRNRRRAQKQAWERRTRHERALRRKAVRFENTIKRRVKLFPQWGPGGLLSSSS